MVIEQKEKPGAKGFARKHWSGGAGRRKEGRDVSGWWFYESPRLHSMLQPTTSQVYICGMGAEGRRRGKKIENAAWRTRNRGAKNKGKNSIGISFFLFFLHSMGWKNLNLFSSKNFPRIKNNSNDSRWQE